MLLAVVIPLRALAVVGTGLCVGHPTTHRVLPVASTHAFEARTSETTAGSMEVGRSVHVHQMAQLTDPGEHKPAKATFGKCGSCSPCHAGVAGPPNAPAIPQLPRTESHPPAEATDFASAAIAIPQKPPRAKQA